MTTIEGIILMIGLVLVSNIISHYLVFIPLSLIQVLLGLSLAIFFKIEIPLKTDWFMLLFIAPLLFNDGRRFPRQELWNLKWPIIGNAIILVFITTLVGGFFINFLVEDLPLSACFALAAILSPTDPIAVQSISSRAKLPPQILHLVSGESLINDASGLIGFKYGIAATVTGVFSLTHAVGDFLYISIVGAIIGVVLMLLIQFLRSFLFQQGINDVVLHTVLQILTPFLIYLIAEEGFEASGVIAVVAAGIVANTRRNVYLDYLPELKIVSERTWNITVYILNGIVFLILGVELPLAMTETIKSPFINTERALLYCLVVWLCILLIRVLWTLFFMFITYRNNQEENEKPSLKLAFLSGLSGVRGAITLAGILSVPLVIETGAAFPERNLMLFIAAGVTILSLVMAVIIIPLITKQAGPFQTRGTELEAAANGMDDLETEETETALGQINEQQARVYIMKLAVKRIESEKREDNQRAAYDLIREYQQMIRQIEESMQDDGYLVPFVEDEVTLRLEGLAGEREVLERLWQQQQIQAMTYKKYRRRLDARERALKKMPNQSSRLQITNTYYRWKNNLKRILIHWDIKHHTNQPHYVESFFVEKELAKGGIKHLSIYLKQPEIRKKQFNRQLIYQIITSYRNKIEQNKQLGIQKSQVYDHQMQGLRAQAITTERTGIQDMMEQGVISFALAGKLRQYVNFSENALILTNQIDNTE